MSDLIKKLRCRQGLTQSNVASKIGVKQSTISRIENGITNISWDVILKVLLCLKASNKEINDFLNSVSSNNCYEFFSLIVQDFKIREMINKDPFFCANKFKQSLESCN